MAEKVCYHCLGALGADTEFDSDGATVRAFCCPACKNIFHILKDSDLGDFYRRRENWKPGRPDLTETKTAYFTGFVRKVNGKDEIDVSLFGLRCASCVWLIERYLSRQAGINQVRVNYSTHRARISWDPSITDLDAIIRHVTSLGYVPHPYSASEHTVMLAEERRALLIRLGIAVFFTLQLMLFSLALYTDYIKGTESESKSTVQLVLWGLATPVMFYAGYPFARNAVAGIRRGSVSTDTLVFIGSFSAYAYSVSGILSGGDVYFDTAAMIITLILLGRYLEAGARVSASEAITSLYGLKPTEARLVSDEDAETKVLVNSLRKGNTVKVIPGEIIPADCKVIRGFSDVDESLLTGESIAVQKTEGSEVFAGTSNLNGTLLLSVERLDDETVLAHIIKTAEDAQVRKAPIQRVAERVVGLFVPLVLLIAASVFAVRCVQGGGTQLAVMNAIAVLVVACPCSLGLATPIAVLVGTSLASKHGIKVKGGDVLEAAAKVKLVMFDKTGTLTTGRMRLIETRTFGLTEDEALRCAASLERDSEHVAAQAIKKAIYERDLYPVDDFRSHPGGGVEGRIGGKIILAGSKIFLEKAGIIIADRQESEFKELSAEGMSVVGLAIDGNLASWFAVSDTVRVEAKEAVSTLQMIGVEAGLITGDGKGAADRAALDAGMCNETRPGRLFQYEMSPSDKALWLHSRKDGGVKVMMVGDGINDAPALTEADVGLAMGRATDIAVKSAGGILMKDDLRSVASFIDIARATLSVIKQNLFWAFSYNALLIPLAAMGKIHPIISAAFMAASSLVVVGNSLSLKFRLSKTTGMFSETALDSHLKV